MKVLDNWPNKVWMVLSKAGTRVLIKASLKLACREGLNEVATLLAIKKDQF